MEKKELIEYIESIYSEIYSNLSFIAKNIVKYNTQKGRKLMTDMSVPYLKSKFRDNEIQVICDDTNNPPTVVMENELILNLNVKIKNQIEYINVKPFVLK